MRRSGRRASLAFCLAAVVLSASAASARTERFRWTHADGSVDSFRLYWGLARGSYSSSINVGVPAKDATGAYYYDVVVSDSATIYATVTAWRAGLESPRSNEISRAAGGTTPPPPPPPSPTTQPNPPNVTVSGWVVHVAPAPTGAAHTSGWLTLYPFDPLGNAVALVDPVSGGPFPRDVDLSPYFAEAVQASRIEVMACAANSSGYACQNRVNVQRGTQSLPSPLGAPGQPYIVP